MQIAYNVNNDVALEGARYGTDHDYLPLSLPWLNQITDVVLAVPTIGNMTIDVTHVKSGQTWSLTVALSSVVLATSLDEIVAAWEADGELRNLADISEDGTDTFTLDFRQGDQEYTFVFTMPGSMTATPTNSQDSGGSGIELGRFVALSATSGEFRALTSTDVAANIAGVLPYSAGNHFRQDLNGDASAVDLCDRGRTYDIARRGGFYMVAEEPLAIGDSLFVRVANAAAGTSEGIGRVRNDADGGDAVAISTLCRLESPAAAAGDLVRVYLTL